MPSKSPKLRLVVHVAALVALCVPLLTANTLAADAPVDFNRDIRPILSDNCFKCHGPDKQRSGLRFDDPSVPVEKKAIVPGDPAASNMIQRLRSTDPEFHMPPPDITPRPSPEQIDTLEKWIAQGAPFARHWAFEPVPPAQAPRVADPARWIRNPVDGFVLQRLNDESLRPQPEAERERLLRRVTLDLTGLPPTLNEIKTFSKDRSAKAYEKVIDRLLASPAYGEQMAVGWLDLARYADTFGYQDDKPNHVWPWRDWVIRAFNDNLPYSDFLRWQLAGDLLPSPTQDQVLATAFNRLHRQTNEGGSINEEFLAEYAADRVKTFGMAFLGLTLECARCHDHKFDPITQRDYYSLFSFFNNIDESGMYSFFTDVTPTPSAFLYAPGQQEEHARLLQALRGAETKAETARLDARARFTAQQNRSDLPQTPPPAVAKLSFETLADGKTPNDASPEKPGKVSGDVTLVEGRSGRAAHFSGENSISVADGIDFERTDPFSIALWLRPGAGTDKMVIVHHSAASMDAASRGYEMWLDGGHVLFSLVHFWPGDAIRVRSVAQVPSNEWIHVALTYNGSSRASGARIYINGVPAETEVIRDALTQTIRYERGTYPLGLAARFRDPGFKDGAIDELQVFAACLTPLEVPLTMGTNVPSSPTDARLDHYVQREDAAVRAAEEALRAARQAEAKFADSLAEIMVMQDMPKPPSAHILARGVYDAPLEEVGPGTPASVLPYPADFPKNRLGLAEWMLRRDHPLTSRVAVNRVWKHFFGRGLVATPEDFGSQGQLPDNQPLLDYLAAWFMDSGWDLKALCNLIVNSATYRQESTATPELLERDPDNILLARGPRNRLVAEQVRDAALASSGLLARTIGGPSVKPYQPGDLWSDASQISYVQDKGEALYRRSMYTYLKRTVPPPMMTTFDAADRETCVARREITTTPLQALVLLNDTQFVEAARVLAEEVLAAQRKKPKALAEAFTRLVGRPPDEREAKILRQTFEEQRALFSASPENAEAYTKTGERPVRDNIDRIDLAAMTAVVQLIMNFDEFQVNS